MMAKRQKDPTAQIRCKQCVEAEAAKERAAAAQRQASRTETTGASESERLEYACSACGNSLPASSFNRTQLNKGPEKQRCQASPRLHPLWAHALSVRAGLRCRT